MGQTSNLSISKPDLNQRIWSIALNSGFTSIDQQIAPLENISGSFGLHIDGNELKAKVDGTTISIDENGNIGLAGGGGGNLLSLNDVASAEVGKGRFLQYDSTSEKWGVYNALRSTRQLVSFDSAVLDQSHKNRTAVYNGSVFSAAVSTLPVNSFADFAQVSPMDSLQIGDTLIGNGSKWVFKKAELGDYSSIDTSSGIQEGSTLMWDGSSFVPKIPVTYSRMPTSGDTIKYNGTRFETTDAYKIVSLFSVLKNGASFGTSPTRKSLTAFTRATFTPSVGGSTTSGNPSYTLRSGYYVLLNNRCYIAIDLTFSSNVSTGDFIISGLPFAAFAHEDGYQERATVYLENITVPIAGSVNAFVEVIPGTTTVKVYTTGSGLSKSALPATIASGTMRFSLTYRTA